MHRVLTIVATSVLCFAHAHATAPTQLTVQGRLTDAAGAALPAGSKSFQFRIFNASDGGTNIWPGGASFEAQTVSSDAAGLWTALVGAITPLTDVVFADTVRWLEVTVSGTTLPRIRLVTAPYAYRVSSVTSGDITNEAGGASTKTSIDVQLSDSKTAILSHSINAPGPGYVLVIATATAKIQHDATMPFGSRPYFNVSSNIQYSNNSDIYLQIPSTAPTGQYNHAVTLHALFPTAGGIDDFWLLGQRDSDDAVAIQNPHLTLIYLPTAYGTVPTSASSSSALPERDFDLASDAGVGANGINEDEIRSELNRLQLQINDLKASLEAMRPQGIRD